LFSIAKIAFPSLMPANAPKGLLEDDPLPAAAATMIQR